jgi:hypothetical protein
VDETVVGAYPYGLRVNGRRTDGVYDAEAVGHGLVDVFGGDRVECLRDFGVKAGQIGADFLPCASAIARPEDELVGVIESFVGCGEDLRKRPCLAVGIV